MNTATAQKACARMIPINAAKQCKPLAERAAHNKSAARPNTDTTKIGEGGGQRFTEASDFGLGQRRACGHGRHAHHPLSTP